MPSKSAKKSLGSDQSRDRALNQVGEEILTALGTVAEAARSTLAGGSGISTSALVNPSNLMVGESKPERLMFAQNSELRAQLRLLLTEPFVARVEVDWASEGGRVETFYFPRRSTAGLGPIGGAHFVSSGAALGRLAEYEAGEVAQVPVGKRERKGRILKRTVIDPREHSGLWDAIVSEFEAMPWGDVLELLRQKSLRAYLDRFKGQPSTPPAAEDIVGRLMQEAADAASARERVRRKVVDRIALRDRPILDKFQGEIFRLSLDRQVILFGPPGSGKTTTLIKRLAQKRTPDALAENELELLSGYLRENLARPDSWAMFSPAELLKQYLGDAFNKQGVPDANNVRTWDKERHDLARNVLYILRGDSRGRFQVEANSSLLIQPLGRGIARLHDDFAAYAEAYLLKSCNNAFAILLQSSDESVKRAVLNLRRVFGVNNNELDLRDVLRLLDNAEGLQAEVKRLNDQIVGELKKIANLLLNTHKTLLSEITSALPTIKKADEDEETEEDADETVPVLATPADVRIADCLPTVGFRTSEQILRS